MNFSLFIPSMWILALPFIALNQAEVVTRAKESMDHWPINTWTTSPVSTLANTYPLPSSTTAIKQALGSYQEVGCWNNAFDLPSPDFFSPTVLVICSTACSDYLMFGLTNGSQCKNSSKVTFKFYIERCETLLLSLLTHSLKN